MRLPLLAKPLPIVLIILVLIALLTNSISNGNAQDLNRTFLDLLKPSTDQEILLSSPSAQHPRPVILKQVHRDYILIETDRKTTEAISLYAITSITLGDPLHVHLNK